MKINCPQTECSSHTEKDPKTSPVVRNGFFWRRSDSRKIRRYFCRCCRTYFSSATLRKDRYQKKRRITYPLFQLYASGMSQRRLAIFLRVSRRTVVRRIRWLAQQEEERHWIQMTQIFASQPLRELQFDDLETSEHTKCKPLSVTLAVDPKTRKVLQFRVARMPAKGHLAELARKKYGPRPDERPEEWNRFFESLTPYVKPECVWMSDENPHYPARLKRRHPQCRHIQTPGGRGSISGQGELKKLRFDPIFSLNHTCAMLRANMNRLFRKTWCLSKTKQGLVDHLWIYISYHNRFLTPSVRS